MKRGKCNPANAATSFVVIDKTEARESFWEASFFVNGPCSLCLVLGELELLRLKKIANSHSQVNKASPRLSSARIRNQELANERKDNLLQWKSKREPQ